MKITSLSQLDLDKHYTFADYFLWQFKERVELIKGKIFKMSPAPNSWHQEVNVNILVFIKNFLKGKKCKVFTAPYDVYLSTPEKDCVVQPDIMVVCDPSKIHKKGCVGNPDLVVEILSPGNSRKEIKYKYELYESCRIQEYWVVYPSEQVVHIHILKNGKYEAQQVLVGGDVALCSLWEDFRMPVEDFFEGIEEIEEEDSHYDRI